MVRAKQVFEVKTAIVVTQRFHLARALWLARRAGLRASGLAADARSYGSIMRTLQAREVAARVKAVGDVVTGAGRASSARATRSPATGAPRWAESAQQDDDDQDQDDDPDQRPR